MLDNTHKYFQGVRKFSYDKTWSAILNRDYKYENKLLIGEFVNYDSSPRHSQTGICFSDITVDKFRKYFEKLIVKNIEIENEYIFLNA